MNQNYDELYGLLDVNEKSTDYLLQNEEYESMNNGAAAGAAAGAATAALGA